MDLLSLIFPVKCLGCGQEGDYLCSGCVLLSKKQWLVCPECRKISPIGQTHDTCRTQYGLDGLVSIYKYRGAVKKAIGKLKYGFVLDIAKSLAQTSSKNIANLGYIKKPILVPIPLYRVRKNWRGFNQTEEMGKILSEKLGWKINLDLLSKIEASDPQVGLSHDERVRNIRGKYAVNTSILKSVRDINESTAVLFDDVWTTGTTMKEACRSLKIAGIKHVWGLTIAR